MRRTLGPVLERGALWLERREVGDVGARMKRYIHEPGGEPVAIDALVSPLRYDVLVRQQFFAFLRAHRQLAEDDFPAFLKLSREQPYFRYVTRVSIPEFRPELDAEDEIAAAYFERRVRACLKLHDDLESNGYDHRRPLILRTGETIAPTTTGKQLSARIFAGDGCHRLAWLREAGVTELEPRMYRLHRDRIFTPRDMTALVLEAIAISPPEYFSFLALSYADRVIDTEMALIERVRSTSPQRLQELKQVIAHDSRLLAS